MLPQKFSAATTAILVPDPVLEPAEPGGVVAQPPIRTTAAVTSTNPVTCRRRLAKR
jgi:hypothetical protein